MPTTRNPYHYPAGGAGEHLLAHRPVGLPTYGYDHAPATVYFHDGIKAEAWDEAIATVARPVPVDEPAEHIYEGGCPDKVNGPDARDPNCPACRPPVVPVDDEPRNPYRTLHARMSPPGAAWDEGFAAGRAAATPDPPTDERRPWPIAPDTVMPPRRQPVRWGSRADDSPTEIHDDPGKTKAYLAGLAAGRTEAAASPDERLREVERALLTVLREAAIIAGSHSDRRDWMVGAIRKQEQVIPELARAGRLILREADAPMEVTVDDVLAALAAADRDKEARDV